MRIDSSPQTIFKILQNTPVMKLKIGPRNYIKISSWKLYYRRSIFSSTYSKLSLFLKLVAGISRTTKKLNQEFYQSFSPHPRQSQSLSLHTQENPSVSSVGHFCTSFVSNMRMAKPSLPTSHPQLEVFPSLHETLPEVRTIRRAFTSTPTLSTKKDDPSLSTVFIQTSSATFVQAQCTQHFVAIK